MNEYYRIGNDWNRHSEVVKRVHPEDGQPIQTPALDEIIKWALDRLTDEEINQRRPSEYGSPTPLEHAVSRYLSWEQVVDALEELWELGLPCSDEYISQKTRQNPMLLFPEFTVRTQELGPRDIMRAMLVEVVRTRINAVGRAAFWDNSLSAKLHGHELYDRPLPRS